MGNTGPTRAVGRPGQPRPILTNHFATCRRCGIVVVQLYRTRGIFVGGIPVMLRALLAPEGGVTEVP